MHQKSIWQKLKKNAKSLLHSSFSYRAAQTFFKQGFSFGLFILAASVINTVDFGIYNYIMSIIFFLMIFTDVSLSNAVTKHLTEDDSDSRGASIVKILQVTALFGSIITIIAMVASTVVNNTLTYLKYAAPLLFLIPLVSAADGYYRATFKLEKLAKKTIAAVLLSAIPSVYFTYNFGIKGAIASQITFYIFLTALLLAGLPWKNRSYKKSIYPMFSYTLILGLGSLGYFFYSRVDILILGYFESFTELGAYEIVNKLFMIFAIPFTVFGQAYSPRITYLVKNNKIRQLQQMFKTHLLIAAVIGLLTGLVIYFGYVYFLMNKFVQYEPWLSGSLMILLPLLPFRMLTTLLVQEFVIPAGLAKYNMYIMFLGGAVNVVLDLLLFKLYGYYGILYCTIAVTILANSALVTIVWRKIKRIKIGEKL